MAAIKAPGFGDNRKAILQDSPVRELFFLVYEKSDYHSYGEVGSAKGVDVDV